MKLVAVARHVVALLAVLSLGLMLPVAPALAKPDDPSDKADKAEKKVVDPDKHDKSGKLADEGEIEPPSLAFRNVSPSGKKLPKLHGPKKFADPVRQTTVGGTAMPNTASNFEGVSNRNGVLPPDSNGAAGPNHYVQFVNLSLAVYSKATGALIYGPVSGNTPWKGFGGVCEATNDGDPVVLYDHLADRWFLSQFALPNYPSGPFYQCIAEPFVKGLMGH